MTPTYASVSPTYATVSPTYATVSHLRWLRLEAAVVVLHKVGGGVVFNFNYLIN